MPAGTQYAKNLNMDMIGIKTPTFYDTNLDEWLMASANVVKTEGGVFIFQKGTDDGRAKVDAQLSGSIPAGTNEIGKVLTSGAKATLTTIVNAETVAAGSKTASQTVSLTGQEKEIWIYVNTDKQPWTLLTSYETSPVSSDSSRVCYPQRLNVATAYNILSIPCKSLYVGQLTGINYGLEDINTLSDAKEMIAYTHDPKIQVQNSHATDPATITVKVLKIWR